MAPSRLVITLLVLFLAVPIALLISNGSLISSSKDYDFRVISAGSGSQTSGEKAGGSLKTPRPKNDGSVSSDANEGDGDDRDSEDEDDDEEAEGQVTDEQQAELNSKIRAKMLRDPHLRDDDVLKQLLNALGDNGPFPIIVGGIGDSGTRGIREVLRAFRVQMLGDSYVNLQGDSRLFEQYYPVYDPQTKTWVERRARDLYKQGIHRARTLRYNISWFSNKTWEYGRQWAGAMLWRTRNVSATLRAANAGSSSFKFWGMKHPRSILVLPFLVSALGDKMRFVHVVRDPKEVVSGDNQQMFLDECRRYYGREKCSRSFEKKYEFWTDVNNDAIRIAKENLSPRSYLMVRIEDFVLGREECFRRLGRFIGMNDAEIDLDIGRAVNATVPHKNSYSGHRLNDMTRTQLYAGIKIAPSRVPQLMESIGYSVNSFKLSKSCYDLPGPG